MERDSDFGSPLFELPPSRTSDALGFRYLSSFADLLPTTRIQGDRPQQFCARSRSFPAVTRLSRRLLHGFSSAPSALRHLTP